MRSVVIIAIGLVISASLACPAAAQDKAAKVTAADIVFAQNFDDSPVGPCDNAAIRRDWPTVDPDSICPDNPSARLAIVDGPDAFRGHSLRALCPKGQASGPLLGGASFAINLGKGNREMYCSYMVKFPKDFDFVEGGKLNGMWGGKFPKAGKGSPADGWNSVVYWNATHNGKKAACQYCYNLDQRDRWGDHFYWEADGQSVTFAAGVWTHVETRVAMNTVGKADGILQTWLNGRLVQDKQDLRFRNNPAIGVDWFNFDIFFGGTEPASKNEYVYFDNFVVSHKRVGPPPAPATTPKKPEKQVPPVTTAH